MSSLKKCLNNSSINNNLGKSRLKWYAPHGWTNKLSCVLEKQLKSSCCLTFKRCDVVGAKVKELKTVGSCKECNGTICIVSTNDIKSLDVEIINVDESEHTFTKKRRLDKGTIETLQQKLATTKPFNLRNELNLDTSLPTESRTIPNLQSLYQISYQNRRKEQFADKVQESLLQMKYSDNFRSCIHDIGLDPFFIMYWTEKQKVN